MTVTALPVKKSLPKYFFADIIEDSGYDSVSGRKLPSYYTGTFEFAGIEFEVEFDTDENMKVFIKWALRDAALDADEVLDRNGVTLNQAAWIAVREHLYDWEETHAVKETRE